MAISASFGAVFVFARKLPAEQRSGPNTFIHKLSRRLKPEYWYWEFVIFVRHLIIAYFAVGVSGVIYKLVFVAVMTVFIVIQWNLAPFSSPSVNAVEFVLLCAVPTVI